MVLGEYLAQAMGRVEEQIASSTSLVLRDWELYQAKALASITPMQSRAEPRFVRVAAIRIKRELLSNRALYVSCALDRKSSLGSLAKRKSLRP